MPSLRPVSPPVKVYPGLILAAKDQRCAGGVRLWHVARNPHGFVDPQDLRSLVGSRRYKRWLPEALRIGALEFWGKSLRVTSIYRLSIALKASPGTPGEIPLRDLLRPGYLSPVWALVRAAHPGSISREKAEELYHVPASTQRLYEKGIPGLQVHKHTGRRRPPDSPWAWAAEFRQGAHPGAWFKKGEVYWPLPNSYTVPISLLPRGSSKRAARFVRAGSVLSSEGARRLFFPRKLEALQALSKHDYSGVSEIYYPYRGQWKAMPLGDS